MVVLAGIGHTKIQAHMGQKIRFWQLDTQRFEIACHIKYQTVGTDLECGAVI